MTAYGRVFDCDCLGDFDVFLDGEFFVRLRHLTYGEALDWSWPIVRDRPLCDIKIRLVSDGD